MISENDGPAVVISEDTAVGKKDDGGMCQQQDEEQHLDFCNTRIHSRKKWQSNKDGKLLPSHFSNCHVIYGWPPSAYSKDDSKENIRKKSSLSKQNSGDSTHSRGSSADRGGSPPLIARTVLEEKRRLREEHHAEEVMKALSVLEKPEQKLVALCTKYAALVEENRIMQQTLKETEKMYTGVVKEKEEMFEELQKVLLAKTKLECLCRELQKCNRSIREEGLQQIRDQEEKRKKLSDKFKDSLDEIHAAMASGRERSDKLSEENQNLAKKLQSLSDQYEAKEEHTRKLVETRELEVQLMNTKLKAASIKLDKLTEESLQERQMLLEKLKEREVEIKELLECEKGLRDQLALYADKYEEFKSNLAESNDSFEKFKSEMEKMNGKLINCERETRKWRGKCDESNKALIEATEAKLQLERKVCQQQKAHEKLEKLTRALQEERNSLIKQLNSPKDASEPQLRQQKAEYSQAVVDTENGNLILNEDQKSASGLVGVE